MINRLSRALSTGTALALSSALAVIPITAVHASEADVDAGDPWGWGRNYDGELGADAFYGMLKRPVPTDGTQVTAISAGFYHSLWLHPDGTVWASGDNYSGQVGGPRSVYYTPVQVAGLEDIVAVSAGAAHSLAVRSDGTVWAWGANYRGQLGDGTTTDRSSPVQVLGLADVVSVGAGETHSLAVHADGTVSAWGSNVSGELGDGTLEDRHTPVKVLKVRDVVSVSGGGRYAGYGYPEELSGFSLAVRADGSVYGWGDNVHGQLGNGKTRSRSMPVRVSGLEDVTMVSAGGDHSLALRSDGTAFAWGDNRWGQLGTGTQNDELVPTEIPDLAGVTDIDAGAQHSQAALADGTAWAWGYNEFGQLGANLQRNTSGIPLQVYKLYGVTDVDAGGSFSLAIVAAAE